MNGMKIERLMIIVMRVSVFVLGFALLRYLSVKLPQDQYDVFITLRLISEWLIAIVILGLPTALPRTIISGRNEYAPEVVLLSSAVIVLPLVFLLFILFFSQPQFISRLIFGHGGWEYVLKTYILFVVVLGIGRLFICYLRGLYHFLGMLTALLMLNGIIPLSIVHFSIAPMKLNVYYYELSRWCFITILFPLLIFYLWKCLQSGGSSIIANGKFKGVIFELFAFGSPKLISGLYQMTLLGTFPIILTFAGANLRQVAAIVIGFTIGLAVSRLLMTLPAMYTFNNIVFFKGSDAESYTKTIKKILRGGVVFGFIFPVMGFVAGDLLVYLVLGDIYGGYEMFVNMGALAGFLFLPLLLLEIPLDGIRPPWQKAKVALFLTMANVIIVSILLGLDLLGGFYSVIFVYMVFISNLIVYTGFMFFLLTKEVPGVKIFTRQVRTSLLAAAVTVFFVLLSRRIISSTYAEMVVAFLGTLSLIWVIFKSDLLWIFLPKSGKAALKKAREVEGCVG